MQNKQKITVETTVNASMSKVWDAFNNPKDIVLWGHASDDWHTVNAENDLKPGGRFFYRMEAKDGSKGFDFIATYDDIVPRKRITYTMADGRKVEITFTEEGDGVRVVETFEAEDENSIELQRNGWQEILNNFKKHVEGN